MTNFEFFKISCTVASEKSRVHNFKSWEKAGNCVPVLSYQERAVDFSPVFLLSFNWCKQLTWLIMLKEGGNSK